MPVQCRDFHTCSLERDCRHIQLFFFNGINWYMTIWQGESVFIVHTTHYGDRRSKVYPQSSSTHGCCRFPCMGVLPNTCSGSWKIAGRDGCWLGWRYPQRTKNDMLQENITMTSAFPTVRTMIHPKKQQPIIFIRSEKDDHVTLQSNRHTLAIRFLWHASAVPWLS